MDSNQLSVLEVKYWQGETSREEEQTLALAARSDAVGLSSALIQLMANTELGKSEYLPEEYNANFWEIVKKEPAQDTEPHFTFNSFLRYAAAAVLLIALGLSLFTFIMGHTETDVAGELATVSAADTYQDPQEAFNQTRDALLFAAQKLNRAKKPVAELGKFHETELQIKNSNLALSK